MIITRLQGGLGNQLFEYAAAKALAVHNNVPLKLDAVTALHKDKLRSIALENLHVTIDLASPNEISKFIWLPKLYRHNTAIFSKLGKNVYREKTFAFDESFFTLKNPVFLDGYWQSEKYFTSIEALIRQEFRVKDSLIKHLKNKENEIKNKHSVSVHIRRGDLENKKAQEYHGMLPLEYYAKAIDTVHSKFPNSYFYIFTDDVGWVFNNFNAGAPYEIISALTKSSLEDFHLMQQCNHNIIANSSFSWWAAWLNNHANKIVVAPQNWFAKKEINTTDLLPDSWLKL